MRELGYDVTGLDASAGQVARAAQVVDRPELVRLGSVLSIPEPDDSLDFVYTVNVLHHLPSFADQQRAFAEMVRAAAGRCRFCARSTPPTCCFASTSYVFPSLNCIDEGVERWILPGDPARYTTASVVETTYFTFFRISCPSVWWRAGAHERWFERSAVRRYPRTT
jgi:SAM-dependent methyltransferase